MKTILVSLPDVAFAEGARQALRHKVPLESLCSSVLADHFLSVLPQQPPRPIPASPKPTESTKFDVAVAYPNAHPGSVALAKMLVDEVLKFPGVAVFKAGRKIGFRPNFVFVEYLTQREPGLAVSFYGEPHRHTNPPDILVTGRRSYSRAKVATIEELKLILPHVAQAYELRFGNNPLRKD